MVRMSYRIIDPVPSFTSPDYSSVFRRESTIPDFRNTLYWNPDMKQGKNGMVTTEFWTSDIVSDYLIRLEGFTPGGKIVSIIKTFRVE
jgi:hypothetical protein